MRKTILLLINGFGVERKGSAEVYSEKLMPNFDQMIKNHLFGNLITTAGDLNTAYKSFSIPEENKGQEDEIDDLVFEKKLGQQESVKNFVESLDTENTLHIFYSVSQITKFNQVREMLKVLNEKKDRKVFLHLVMTSTSTAGYDVVKKIISKISFELGEYCKVGMIVGKNNLNSDDMLRALYRELGEHWNEFEKKIQILEKEVIAPENAGVFIVNGGYSFKAEDSVLLLNYDTVEMEKFYSEIVKVTSKIHSMFPYKEGVPFLFKKNDEISTCFTSTIEKFGIKVLMLTAQNRINDINFYLNGMEKKKSPNLTYAINDAGLFASKEAVVNLVDGNPYEGFIIDFTIANYDKMEDIKAELAKIDGIIKNISDAAQEKDYTFIISSLYGMHVPIMDGVIQKVIDFSGKVPLVFQSSLFPKTLYTLNSGSLYSLAQTFLTNINDEVKANRLVHKLSGLEKMLTKGK